MARSLYRSLLARPLDKIYVKDLLVRYLYAISVLALYKSFFGGIYLCKRSRSKMSATDLYAMSLYKISLCRSSLEDVSWQDLCKRPLGKISGISEQDLHQRLLGKISVQAPYKRSLGSRKAQGHVTRAILYGKMQDTNTATPVLREPARSKCTWTSHKSHFYAEIYREMPYAWTGDIVSCEPAQSKCTWTCQKSHFMQKFSGNWPDTDDTTSIEHRALTLTTRTPSVWPHCLGKKH